MILHRFVLVVKTEGNKIICKYTIQENKKSQPIESIVEATKNENQSDDDFVIDGLKIGDNLSIWVNSKGDVTIKGDIESRETTFDIEKNLRYVGNIVTQTPRFNVGGEFVCE